MRKVWLLLAAVGMPLLAIANPAPAAADTCDDRRATCRSVCLYMYGWFGEGYNQCMASCEREHYYCRLVPMPECPKHVEDAGLCWLWAFEWWAPEPAPPAP